MYTLISMAIRKTRCLSVCLCKCRHRRTTTFHSCSDLCALLPFHSVMCVFFIIRIVVGSLWEYICAKRQTARRDWKSEKAGERKRKNNVRKHNIGWDLGDSLSLVVGGAHARMVFDYVVRNAGNNDDDGGNADGQTDEGKRARSFSVSSRSLHQCGRHTPHINPNG